MRVYKILTLPFFLFLIFVFIFGCHRGIRPIDEIDHIPRISKEELKTRMGDPSVSIIDVRYKPNWEKSDRLISGAVREDPMELGSWIHKYPKNHMIVLYCD